MAKPQTRRGYGPVHTVVCERVLVTLLRGLGPWKESVYLVGGLTPRYLATADAPPHAGTLDVDVVIDLQILVNTRAYHSLEENLRRMGFIPIGGDGSRGPSWRWQVRTEGGVDIVLELLTDAPEKTGGQVQALPAVGAISALHIPHSSIVFDHHRVKEIRAELLGGNGIATETIRHADILSFTCLKAFAFDQRGERKDSHDLIYCIEHAPGGLDAVAKSFREARAGKHGDVVEAALGILRRRFASDEDTEGYLKDGPVAVSKFELGEAAQIREARTLRQRHCAAVVEELLARIG